VADEHSNIWIMMRSLAREFGPSSVGQRVRLHQGEGHIGGLVG
jgi:hypothetical protein